MTCPHYGSPWEKMIWKKSYTRRMGNRSTTRSREEEYRVKPFELMALPKFSAVVKHCEKRFRRTRIHPIDPEGKIPRWYPWWKRVLPFGEHGLTRARSRRRPRP